MCHAKSWFKRDGRPIPQWTRPGVTPIGPSTGSNCCAAGS